MFNLVKGTQYERGLFVRSVLGNEPFQTLINSFYLTASTATTSYNTDSFFVVTLRGTLATPPLQSLCVFLTSMLSLTFDSSLSLNLSLSLCPYTEMQWG